MASGRLYRAAVTLAAVILTGSEAAAEVSTHIPPAPDPALSRSAASRQYDGFEIRVAPPVTIAVKIPQLLRTACRTEKAIWACTFFASERLDCECVRGNGGWRVDAVVEFVPVMYLRSPRFQEHELKHVEHLTDMLSNYLRRLVGREFRSQIACAAVAEQEMTEFTKLMNELRRASNQELR